MHGDLRCKQIKRLNDLPTASQKVPVAKPGVLSAEPGPSTRSLPRSHPAAVYYRRILRCSTGEDHRAATEPEEKNKQQLLLASLQVHHRQMKNPSFKLNGSPATPLNRNPETEILWLCQPRTASGARHPPRSLRQPDVFTQ